MRFSAKLGLTALMAALLLASAVNIASAGRLSTSNQNFRVTWSRLEFQSAVTIRCQVTLEGSFHARSIAKVERTLIGGITRADVKEESCTGGTARANSPFPWHVTYESFEGTLPTITAVNLLLQRFLFTISATIIGIRVTCRYGLERDNITGRANLNAERAVTTLVPVAGRNIASFLEGSGLCPATGTLAGASEDGRVTVLNSSSRLTITLI